MIETHARISDADAAGAKPGRILIVDYDDGLRQLIQKVLLKAGYDAEGVATGAAAFDRVKADPGLVLLLDQKLPDMAGSDLIHALHERDLRVPFVVMTGQGNEQLAVDMMKLGAADYLVKTLDLVDVLPGVFDRLFRALDTERQLRAAEEALRESEERFSKAFQTSPYAITITHAKDGAFVEVNDAFTSMTGVTRAEALASSSVGLNLWVDGEDREQAVSALREGRAVVNRVFQFRKKTGETFTGLFSAQSIRLGNEPCILSSISDIPERKALEHQLGESHLLLSNLARLVPGVIYQYRLYPDGRSAFPYSSPGMNDIYEVTPEDVREDATPVFGRLHPDDYNDVANAIQESARTLQTFYCEFRVVLPRQGLRWRWSQAQPERTEDGGTLWHGIISDITERKLAEEALRESEERMRLLLNSTAESIYGLDMDGNCTFCNDACLRLLGYTHPEELLGKNMHRQIHAKRPDGTPFPLEDCRIFQAFKDGRGTHVDDEVLWRADGTSFPAEYWSYPQRHDDIVVGAVVAFVDITARKRAGEAKAKLEAQLQQAQKMESVGRLAGGVAHDFNNMLGVILGHAEMALAQVDATQPYHADLEEIRKAATRSADLTRQLLAFARKQTIAPKVLDLNDIVEGMLKMLQRLIGEDIHLVWQPGAGLWPVHVDPSQIDQILANLCVNARDAIAGVGKLTIETTNTTFDEAYCGTHAGYVPGDYVRLTVSDDGSGMDTETVSHLFEPFFTTKDVGKGTGLGLATVYGIVKQNLGFINVYSESGHGTTFTISLPRHMGKSEQMQTDVSLEPAQRGHETILLVEDEPAILALTTRMLERQGYTVLAAHTPGEAIRLAREYVGEIHLLMTDVVMPEMNGRDLARNLVSLYPHLGRLFMSGYTSNVIAHHGVLDDGVCFIQKPFSVKNLAAKVREALDRG